MKSITTSRTNDIVIAFDQEIPQSQTAGKKTVVPQGRAT